MNLLELDLLSVTDAFSPEFPFALLHDNALTACKRLPQNHFTTKTTGKRPRNKRIIETSAAEVAPDKAGENDRE